MRAAPAVELLWWEGCPSHPDALTDLERILVEEGLGAEVELVEIETDEQARSERFPGSPTIRIAGEDIVPPGEGEPFTLTCRVYRLRDGRISPTPDPEDVRAAVRRAKEEPMSIAIGASAPGFTLPDTDGAEHSPADDGITAVVFTCNHCPYALAWHDRLTAAARDYPDVRFLAINPNDAERYPGDSLEAMQLRVAQEDWAMPYLRDESQEVARAYGAQTTPDIFVIDGEGRLRYRGAPDEDHNDPSLNAAWLREALDALLAGEEPARAETPPKGCSVKWKNA